MMIETVLSRLPDARKSGDGWSARCPAHEDRRASLSIARSADGTILLKCHAGCDTSAVIKAIGLELRDLFPSSNGHVGNGHARRQTGPTHNGGGKPTGRVYPTYIAARAVLCRKLGAPAGIYQYHNVQGELVGAVYRWDGPAGKTIRPTARHGDGWRIGGMPAPRPLYNLQALAEASRVYVFEGEKCVDAAKAIGLTATTSAHGSQSPDKTSWAPLAGKEVIVLPDNDPAGWRYADTVVSLLHRLNPTPTIKIVHLPDLSEGGDIADWIVAHGDGADPAAMRAELEPLVEAAAAVLPPAAPPKSEPSGLPPIRTDRPNEAEDDPHRLARLCLWPWSLDLARNGQEVPPQYIKLRYWQGEWCEWDGCAYRTISSQEVKAMTTDQVKAEFDRLNLEELAMRKSNPSGGDGEEKGPPKTRRVTARLMADVIQALASMVTLPSTTEPPAWISGEGPFPAGEIMAMQNALVHLPSLVGGKVPHSCSPTLNFFGFNCCNYDFHPDAPRPDAWLSFLGQLWPGDQQSIDTLQEWMGYLLTSDTRQQKILMLIGPKRSGKGTIARVIRALIGPQNVAGPTLSSLGTNFGLWPLLGKSAAIVSDARLSGRTDSATIIERLLSISGEDALTIDRKNLSPVTVRLGVRFMLLTNELPRLGDSSGALASRMILLRLTQSWYDNEKHNLTEKLLAELPGILLWTIGGWQRLRDRGRFIQPDAGRELLGELDDLASPIGAFVRERCILDAAAEIERGILFQAWREWCQLEGKDHSGDKATFGRNLHAAVPGLRDAASRIGGRHRVYRGIHLRAQI